MHFFITNSITTEQIEQLATTMRVTAVHADKLYFKNDRGVKTSVIRVSGARKLYGDVLLHLTVDLAGLHSAIGADASQFYYADGMRHNASIAVVLPKGHPLYNDTARFAAEAEDAGQEYAQATGAKFDTLMPGMSLPLLEVEMLDFTVGEPTESGISGRYSYPLQINHIAGDLVFLRANSQRLPAMYTSPLALIGMTTANAANASTASEATVTPAAPSKGSRKSAKAKTAEAPIQDSSSASDAADTMSEF